MPSSTGSFSIFASSCRSSFWRAESFFGVVTTDCLAPRTLGVAKGDAVVVKTDAAGGGALFVAIVENNLVTQIGRGENGGLKLRNDYVVRIRNGSITGVYAVSGCPHVAGASTPIPEW